MLLPAFLVVKAQNHTVSGYISDHSTKEILIGATVIDCISGKGALTNSYGFYSLTLPAGNVKMRFQSVGYSTHDQAFNLTKDTVVNILLSQSALELEEIVVTANQNIVNTKYGAIHIPIEKIKNTPALFGESDLIKSLQYIPGVILTFHFSTIHHHKIKKVPNLFITKQRLELYHFEVPGGFEPPYTVLQTVA